MQHRYNLWDCGLLCYEFFSKSASALARGMYILYTRTWSYTKT